MLSKSKKFKHGKVSAQSVGSQAHNVASKTLKKPSIVSYKGSDIVLDETIPLSRINLQKSVEILDKITGINSDSPEIIALSNFIPAYDKNGNLNEFGDFLRKKQDALLIRAASNISNILSSPEVSLDNLVSNTDANSQSIVGFCENSARGIEDLLTHFSKIKRKMDFRSPLDKETLRLIGSLPPDIILNDDNSPNLFPDTSILPIEEVLFENSDTIKHWTPTKVWIQSCLELKELLSNGMVSSFLSDGGLLGVDPTNYSYYDPYTLTPSRNSLVKKFGFNETQNPTHPLQGLVTGDPTEFKKIVQVVSALFVTGDSSIFNEKIFTDISSLDESIAKLSYVLCKEYVYSTQMRSDVLSDYGYPFALGGKNVNVWNHLIGQAGSDITDIPAAPLGGGKSLISLASSREPDGAEVLSFEDRYINDNIGTVRPDAIIVPGTLYYIENSINITNGGFNLTSLNRYVTKLSSATNMLKMVKEDLGFLPVEPYSSVNNKVLNKSEAGATASGFYSKIASTIVNKNRDPKKEEIKNALSNPISLIRHIEQNVLNGSGLLRRSNGPKLWTNRSFFDVELDVSALLISLAIDKDDPELQALLFLHQLYSHSYSRPLMGDFNRSSSTNASDAVVKTQIVDRILDTIKNLLETDTISVGFRSNEQISISLSAVKEALLSPKNSSSLRILNRIGELFFEFDENFDFNNTQSRTNGRFFLERTTRLTNTLQRLTNRNDLDPADKISAYSGVQKTSYVVSLFKLCCLLVHAANPERFITVSKPSRKFQSVEKITIKRVRNAIVGTFLSLEEINQGVTKFNFDQFTNSGFFPAAKDSTNTKKLKIFELPNSSKKGIKVFDIKNTSKKTISNNKNASLTVLYYDDVIVKTENMLADYIVKFDKYIDRFYGFVYSLKDEFLKLKNNLQSNGFQTYSRSLLEFSRLIADPNISRTLMNEQQLMLMKSRMVDYVERLNKNSYISPLRESIPHFINISDKNNIENFLPIEDVHLVSWNLFLKDFLKSGPFYTGDGSNKKIISVGIPQKLHRKMRVNASRLSGLVDRNNLIQLCIFRVNSFLPDVIYKPLVYNFDLSLFPTKILSNYKKCGFSISENTGLKIHKNLVNFERICLSNNNIESSTNPDKLFTLTSDFIVDFIPHLKSNSNYKFTLTDPANKSTIKENSYSFLSDQQFSELYRNHSISFLLEEYLRFVTDVPLDENKYTNYDVINTKRSSKFTKFTSEFMDPNRAMNPTFENFFNDENLLSGIIPTIRTLVMPKKFDRVFHLIFDPDDFQLDPRTPQEVIQKYVGKNGKIEDLTKNENDEPTFDKYYVVIKSNEGSDAS
jgi:hypothetical protein